MNEARTIPPFGLRMPEDLRQKLKEVADNNRRSMNSEIVIILEKAIQQQSPETQNGSVTA